MNFIWIINFEDSELIFQEDMDTTQFFIIIKYQGINPSMSKVKQDFLVVFLTKNKKVIIESTNDVNVVKFRNWKIPKKGIKGTSQEIIG